MTASSLAHLSPQDLHDRTRQARLRLAGCEWELANCLLAVERSQVPRQHGCSSVIHYATQVLELCAHKAGELLRVARALEPLPLLAECFRTGRLSWSKIREVTRMATSETEAEWMEFALRNDCNTVQRAVSRSPRAYHQEVAARAAGPDLFAAAEAEPSSPLSSAPTPGGAHNSVHTDHGAPHASSPTGHSGSPPPGCHTSSPGTHASSPNSHASHSGSHGSPGTSPTGHASHSGSHSSPATSPTGHASHSGSHASSPATSPTGHASHSGSHSSPGTSPTGHASHSGSHASSPASPPGHASHASSPNSHGGSPNSHSSTPGHASTPGSHPQPEESTGAREQTHLGSPPRPPAQAELVCVRLYFTPDQFAVWEKAGDRIRSARPGRRLRKEEVATTMAREVLAAPASPAAKVRNMVVINVDAETGQGHYETSRGVLPASPEAVEEALTHGVQLVDAPPAEAPAQLELTLEQRPKSSSRKKSGQRPPIPLRLIKALAARARGRCEVPGCRNCGPFSIHHKTPWSRGGRHTLSNLELRCAACHTLAHEDDYEQLPDWASARQQKVHKRRRAAGG